MTPLQFEARYAAQWAALEAALGDLEGGVRRRKDPAAVTAAGAVTGDPAELARLYRGACEHLALARARDYPAPLLERLEQLTQRAHQQVYQVRRGALAAVLALLRAGIPRAIRAQRVAMLVALAVFALPLLGTTLAAAIEPSFALRVHSAETLRDFERMYGADAESFGQPRSGSSDVHMFGFYVMNNIGLAFRCFAGGLFLGIGALAVLFFNGLFAGTLAGHLGARGLAGNFYGFVVTHGAFELTAIVLAGGAGLVLGYSLLAPGRRSRLRALQASALAVVPVLYGAFVLLLIAAFVEAFWSSARWVPNEVKFGIGGLCWALVLAWLLWAGRSGSSGGEASGEAGSRPARFGGGRGAG